MNGAGRSLLKRAGKAREVGSLDDPGTEVAHWTDRLPCWTGFAVLVVAVAALDGVIVLLTQRH